MNTRIFIILCFWCLSLSCFSQIPYFRLDSIKSQTQLLDSNSFAVCRGDSVNMQIRIGNLSSNQTTQIFTNIDSVFSSAYWELTYPFAPNSYETVIFKLVIQNLQSNKYFNPWFIQIEDSMYATFDFWLVDSLIPNIHFVSDKIYGDIFKAEYTWFKNDSLIQGAPKNREFKPTESGTYYALVNTNCGVFKSNDLYYEVAGVNQISFNESLEVYPNPTSDFLKFNFQTNHQIRKIEIVDILGNVVFNAENFSNSINISELTKGIYFVRILLNERIIISRRFIKN